ncbi:MAG: MFS transporter [Spirochaetes bacterium]|nr:MFS transporter [Spirochaetota bacterium]
MKRLSFYLYAAGSAGLNLLNLFLLTKILFFHDARLGPAFTPLFLAAGALGIGRVVDAFLDPLLGLLSDRLARRYSRGGRGWMMGASLPLMALAFLGIWHPPFSALLPTAPMAHGHLMNFLFLLAAVNLYFIAYAAYGVPYDALLAEIATDPPARLRASRFKALAGLIGVVLALPLLSRGDIPQMGLIALAIATPLLVMPLFVLPRQASELAQTRPPAQIFFLRRLFADKAFLLFALTVFFMESAGNLFLKWIEYFNRHVLPASGGFLPPGARQGFLYGIFALSMALGLLFWEKRSDGKRQLHLLSIAALLLAFIFPFSALPGALPAAWAEAAALGYFAAVGFVYAAVALFSIAIMATHASRLSDGPGASALHVGAWAFARKTGLAAGGLSFALFLDLTRRWGVPQAGYAHSGLVMALFALGAYLLLRRMAQAGAREAAAGL